MPGAVSGWVSWPAGSGSLPSEQLFEPAVKNAEAGFHVTPRTATGWARSAELHGQREEFARHFRPADAHRAQGELFRSPDQATTLQAIATTQGEAFYRGALAEKMACRGARDGGLTEADLASSQRRLGGNHLGWFRRRRAPRDPAQRPGHSCAHGARHAARVRPSQPGSGGRRPCTCRSRP